MKRLHECCPHFLFLFIPSYICNSITNYMLIHYSSQSCEELQEKWLMIHLTTKPSEIEGSEIRDSKRLIPCTTTIHETSEEIGGEV